MYISQQIECSPNRVCCRSPLIPTRPQYSGDLLNQSLNNLNGVGADQQSGQNVWTNPLGGSLNSLNTINNGSRLKVSCALNHLLKIFKRNTFLYWKSVVCHQFKLFSKLWQISSVSNLRPNTHCLSYKTRTNFIYVDLRLSSLGL